MIKGIIGISGLMSSGKGAVSQYLVERHGFIEISFANAVKDSLSSMFGWDRSMLEGDSKESREWRNEPDKFWSIKFGHEVTPRWAMQNFATELVRKHFCEDFWVNVVEKFITENQDSKIVVSDCRFPNEIDLLLELGAIMIEVQPDVLPEWYDVAYEDNKNNIPHRNEQYGVHVSEWVWIGYNIPQHTIVNNGTLPDLYNKVDRFIQ